MLSVTTITTYIYCPRKLYLTKILDFVEPPKDIMVLGSLRHDIYDKLNKAEKQIVLTIETPETVQQAYKHKYAEIIRDSIIKFKPRLKTVNLELIPTFKHIWPIFEKEYQLRAQNLQQFITTHNLLGEQLWEQLTPKIESEIKLKSETLDLIGIVDRIELHPTEIIPTEVKTGKAPKDLIWKAHKIQIAAYMMMLEEKYNTKITKGYVHYVNEDKKFEVIMNPFLQDEIKDLIQKVKALLKSDTLPPILDTPTKCNACNLKEDCYKLKDTHSTP